MLCLIKPPATIQTSIADGVLKEIIFFSPSTFAMADAFFDHHATRWTLLLAACFSHTLMWSVPSPTVALPIAGFMHQLQGFLPFSLIIFMGLVSSVP